MPHKQAHAPQWQAAEARHRFSEVVDAAAAGAPQFVRRRDGQEVVVVSKEYFERTRPTLKSLLLDYKWKHEDKDGAFEEALREARRVTSAVLTPSFEFDEEREPDDAGHKHHQRAANRKKQRS